MARTRAPHQEARYCHRRGDWALTEGWLPDKTWLTLLGRPARCSHPAPYGGEAARGPWETPSQMEVGMCENGHVGCGVAGGNVESGQADALQWTWAHQADCIDVARG